MSRHMKQLEQLQAKLGIRFTDSTLLKQAFTHSSYVNEQRMEPHSNNERLEFLGDAVLQISVSEFLYTEYPLKPEGELSKLRASIVCEPSLAKHAAELEFGSLLILGKGEEMTGGRSRPSLLADVFEAFVGALYLDQGLERSKSFVKEHLLDKLPKEGTRRVTDFKTQLQELAQRKTQAALEYRIVSEQGPAHDRRFVSEVYLEEQLVGRGEGRSKKEAEQQAASEALSRLSEKQN